jgi:hypothetical protein
MKTSNFDLLVEIKEDLINRAFAIAYYTSALPTIINGKLALSKKLPPEMRYLGDVDFELRLKEPPTVDAILRNGVCLLFNIEFSISMMHGIRNQFDITASITAAPELDAKDQLMKLDFRQGMIDKIVFNDRYKVPAKSIKAMDEVIKATLRTNLLDKLENIDLQAFFKPLCLPDPLEGIDAVALWNNGKAYFFKGENYIRYDIAADQADEGYPSPIYPNWPGVWAGGIDAALVYPGGKAYFFKEELYMRYDMAADHIDPGYPARIEDGWKGVWTDGIDAAVTWNNGKAYFFKGDQYIRFDIAADKADEGYPKDIAGNWPGIWTTGIDSVVMWNNGKAYFFKGDEYIRYDVAADKADPGYPVKVKTGWNNVWLGKIPLAVRPGGFRMFDNRVFALGVNLFDNAPGDILHVKNYVGNNDLWVGIREQAMHQIFDSEWANTAFHMKRKHWSDTFTMVSDDIRGYVNKFNDVLLGTIPNLLSLGVLSSDLNIDYLKCDASATVAVEKPEFDLFPGNKIKITNLRVNVNLYLRVYTKVTTTTTIDPNGWWPDFPGQTDIIETSSTTINLINQSFHASEGLKEVQAELICDLTKGISGKVTSMKFDLDLGIDLLSDMSNWILDHVTALILPLIPPINLLPALIEEKINTQALNVVLVKDIVTLNATDYVVPKTISLKIEPGPVTIDEEELTACAKISLTEMPRKTFAIPLFVANCNPKRMEVHRIDCNWVNQIDQAYKAGYYVLNDATNDGFDGCKYCLPEYHTR